MRCRNVSVESPSGFLTGIEDMAGMSNGALLLSAYSRRNPEDWPVGLFIVQPDFKNDHWTAKPLLALGKGTFPHGFAVNETEETLAVIIRSKNGKPKLGLYDLEDEALQFRAWLADPERWTSPIDYPCNMNDAAFISEADVVVTNDRASCTSAAKLIETVTGKASGQLLKLSLTGEVERLDDSLYFPNGVTGDTRGDVFAAQTRGKKLSQLKNGQDWDLPGAPDNVLYDNNSNSIWAAAIPSLLRYSAFQRGLLPGKSASLAIQVSLEHQSIETYITSAFEGATSVALLPNALVLSGAFSDGLALCDRPDA
ncbi:MAG: hypothetical protein AAF221_06930 [Pseudomonadota bacterium]